MRITRTTPILLQENPNLWDSNKTLKENAGLFKISEGHARKLADAGGLNFKSVLFGKKKKPNTIRVAMTRKQMTGPQATAVRIFYSPFHLVKQDSEESPNNQRMGDDQGSVFI